MPALSTLSISNDGGTTTQSYDPISTSGDSVTLADRSALTGAGQSTLSLAFSQRSAKRPTDRVTIKLALPYEETVSGVTTVNHVARAEVSVVIPEQFPATERAKLGELLLDALANASVQSYIQDLEPMY
jgi:hypothetical protein